MPIKTLFSIPNLLTLANLFLGCMAIHFLFHDEILWVLVCISLALLADFIDGYAARALGIASPIGRELDSLADMVSFGLIPGIMMYLLIAESAEGSENFLAAWSGLPFLGFIITLFSALRLAIFNLDETQTDHFKGLATPANTIFFLGVFFIAKQDMFGLRYYVMHPFFLLLLTLLFSYLLISPFKLFKPKPVLRWKEGHRRQIILLIAAIPAFIFLKEAALSFLVLLYILLSLSRQLKTGR
jgi:CDP-diacylglycerol--serine O-phosphatidyltransferase